jgi:hypothetical protein
MEPGSPLALLVFYGLLIWGIVYLCRRGKQRKREWEEKLLRESPESWERMKRLEMEKAERNKESLGKAGMVGIQIASKLLKK